MDENPRAAKRKDLRKVRREAKGYAKEIASLKKQLGSMKRRENAARKTLAKLSSAKRTAGQPPLERKPAVPREDPKTEIAKIQIPKNTPIPSQPMSSKAVAYSAGLKRQTLPEPRTVIHKAAPRGGTAYKAGEAAKRAVSGARSLAAGLLNRAKGALQTGLRGGRFYVSKSGEKTYVK